MPHVSIIGTTKDYITIRIPRSFVSDAIIPRQDLTESAALKIFQEGMKEYRGGKTRKLTSLKELRHGH